MAAGTDVQRAAGYTDDADTFFRHYLIANSWICDPAVVDGSATRAGRRCAG